ncbi:tc5 transposase DNA-binding domain-containing protein [Phthorimaea operculella]|nr:tc5 transposase DNA-binding domain-containing protein [Phthorimaea operculella]
MDKPRKKSRHYSECDLRLAEENVLSSSMSIYKASKSFKIPWSTLKENVKKYKALRENNQHAQIVMSKIGRPFALPVEIEHKLVAYIDEMQERGYGLSVTKIKQYASSLAKAANIDCPFNEEKGCAGWNWWVKFKDRYGLSLRTPENRSAGRSRCSNPVVLDDFYKILEEQVIEHVIPSRVAGGRPSQWGGNASGATTEAPSPLTAAPRSPPGTMHRQRDESLQSPIDLLQDLKADTAGTCSQL